MNLYVGNLPKETKNRELEKLFEEYGKIVSAAIARDKKSGASRGFGFVEMANRHEGEQAIAALNETEYKGQKLRVNEAKEREERGNQGRGHGNERFEHQAQGRKRGGWDHGARGAHTNRGQGGKRGL